MSGLHSCPSCPNTTTADDLCDNCDPGPLLASLADARVSPDAIRAAVEAEREEIAALCEEIARDHGALGAVATLCALKIRSRGRVSFG
jgi:hypothetical protein